MRLEDIIKQIENVSKNEIKRIAPADCHEINEIIKKSDPTDLYEKMVSGYLTSICAECMYPETFILEKDNLEYIGFELEKGNIEVGTAGNMLGTCMKGGKIFAKKAGEETGKSMTGGEIIADNISSIGSTIGGRISTKNVNIIAKNQGADIYIGGVKFKRRLIDRLLGRRSHRG